MAEIEYTIRYAGESVVVPDLRIATEAAIILRAEAWEAIYDADGRMCEKRRVWPAGRIKS
jgi:predicted glycosyltransferase